MAFNTNTTFNRTVIRGDSDPFTFKFYNVTKNSLGVKIKTPMDISDWTVKLTVRADIPSTSVKDDNDAIISKIAIKPEGTVGVALFDITSNDTDKDERTYWYDIQYTVGSVTKSFPKAKYIITSDITRG